MFMPQNGYLTLGTGKVSSLEDLPGYILSPVCAYRCFTLRRVVSTTPIPTLMAQECPPNQDPRSWTEGLSMQRVNDVANMYGCTIPNSATELGDCPVDAASDGTIQNPHKDPQLCDRVIADDAIIKLRLAAANLAATGQPFFVAAGFRKPHLAWRFPKPWLDKLPALEDVPVAAHPTMDPSVPPIAHHDSPPQGTPYVSVDPTLAKRWRLYYMAPIAWMDSQVCSKLL